MDRDIRNQQYTVAYWLETSKEKVDQKQLQRKEITVFWVDTK